MGQKRVGGLLSGVLVAFGIFLACVVCLSVFLVPLSLNSGVLKGWKIIEKDPSVAAMFGTPVKPGLVCMGGTKSYMDCTGQGSLTSFIMAPKGIAMVEFYVSRNPDTGWNLDSMRILRGGRLVMDWIASQSSAGFQLYH